MINYFNCSANNWSQQPATLVCYSSSTEVVLIIFLSLAPSDEEKQPNVENFTFYPACLGSSAVSAL